MNKEAQALNTLAKEHHDENFDKTFVPPFEIYVTTASCGSGKVHTETKTIGIKSNVAHTMLLKEMLVHISKNSSNNKPTIKFIPTGLVNSIGAETYEMMICNNNQYLVSITTIPVVSFTNAILNLKIDMHDPIMHSSKRLIHNIMLDTPWCHAIESTQTIGKFLFVTTKVHLHEDRQWLDDHLPPMFANYIDKHPEFIPTIDNPVAIHANYCLQTSTMETYVEC